MIILPNVKIKQTVRSDAYQAEEGLDLSVAKTVSLELVNHSRVHIIQCIKEKKRPGVIREKSQQFCVYDCLGKKNNKQKDIVTM